MPAGLDVVRTDQNLQVLRKTLILGGAENTDPLQDLRGVLRFCSVITLFSNPSGLTSIL
jgi:hypothetical protein